MCCSNYLCVFFFSSRRRHTRLVSDWSSDVCSSDLDLYGVDIIESDGTPYVVDMNSFPGFKSVPDAPLRLAKYLYAAAERAARGQPLFESAVLTEAVSTEGAR